MTLRHLIPLAISALSPPLFFCYESGKTFASMFMIESIILDPNPWDCSCRLVGLMDWVEDLRERHEEDGDTMVMVSWGRVEKASPT